MKTNYLGFIKVLESMAADGLINNSQTLAISTMNYKPIVKIGDFAIKTNQGKFEIRRWDRENKMFRLYATAWTDPVGNINWQNEVPFEDEED